jgi:hypothetical protein
VIRSATGGRSRTLLLAALVLVAVSAACSDDGTGSSSATDATPPAAPSTALDPPGTAVVATDPPSDTAPTDTAPDGSSSTTAPAPSTSAPIVYPDAIPIVFDTDANNELDDQHALAYALLRPDVFELVAVTSNATRNGGNAEAHAAEAERILALTGRTGSVPVVVGADGSFDEIRPLLGEADHDGHAAVDTIIDAARADDDLVVIAVGKLTNVALALEKAPDIVPGLRVVWLGSNYPLGGGEYNLDNDPGALTSVLDDGVDAGLDFEIATVRPGDPTGTAAVQLTLDEAADRMPGLGPTVDPAIVGRTGRRHATFGDYSAELFRVSEPFGDPPRRSLFDLAGVSIVGEPGWARPAEVPAPSFLDGEFVERPNRDRTILYWEQFDSEAILGDFFTTLETAGTGP